MEIIRKLVENGAKIYNEELELRDISPIFYAIRLQNINSIEYFCNRGLEITKVKNSKGLSALGYAADNDYDEIVNYLTLRT